MVSVYGYIRVSTNKGQTTDNQRKEILDGGYNVPPENFFSETGVSGSVPQFKRPAFKAMFDVAEPGSVCVFSKIDRLGRDAHDILATVKAFKEKGIKVIVLQFGGVDMSSSAGKFLTSILAACAEMERDLCIERVNSGLARAAEEGKVFGPPLKLVPDTLVDLCVDKKNGYTYDMLATKYNLQRTLIARNVSRWKDDLAGYREEYFKREEQYKQSEIERLRRKKAA